MPETIEVLAYSFDELSDQAKEKARDWYRESSDSSDFDFVIEDFVTICDIIGVDLKTHEVQLIGGKTRSEPNVWWSLSYSQGDGACFEGKYWHNGDSCAKIREHCSDEELLRIVDELNRIQSARILLGKSTWEVDFEKADHHYCHENTISFDITEATEDDDDDPVISPDVDAIEGLFKDLMRWLHKQLRDEHEHQTSDEVVDENIIANEYKFDEEGRRHAYA